MSNTVIGNVTNEQLYNATAINGILDDLAARVPKIADAAPVNATQASGTLTISGVAIDGETVTIGGQVYEFDTDGSVTSGNVTVDISGDATASQGTLTVDTQPTAYDTMTVGERTYVFVPDGDESDAGEISVGADLAGAQANIVAALNGTDGINSVSVVEAADFATNDCGLTARTPGIAGDSIVTTETFTSGTNVFDAGTLGTTQAGADCAAADAVTALVAAINGDSSAEVTAADGDGDTVDVTAVAAGTAGNSIGTTETMANGAWGDTDLTGGTADGTPGEPMEQRVYGGVLYINISDEATDAEGSSWYKATLTQA